MQTVQTWKSFRDLKWVQGSRKTVPHRGYSLKELQQRLRRRKWERHFKNEYAGFFFFYQTLLTVFQHAYDMSNEGEFALAEFPGTAPKFKTSQICFPFDVLLHLTVDTVIDIIILISPWLINEDSLCCLLCPADSDTTRVAHVFLFSACNQAQRKTKTWYEVHYRWTCFAVIHTMPGEQSSSVSALGKCADND